ncbi:kinesin-5, putative [Plasmodium ovale]|uniref:Kinesin-5, putative n=1 Tax=Plasmodium ovale TaxID=36330 RepID=A0A1D3TH12_PLAOA|nr:kinesin-5, putative [Plasmodium ovale]
MLRNSYNNDKSSCVNIKVIVRCRPLNEKEKNDINNEEVVKISNNEVILTINRNNEIYEKKYSFDYACDENVNQKTLFNNYLFQIVDEVLEGFNCTLFCYGQTGTGKTYTMEGRILEHLKNNESRKVDLSDSVNSDINYYYELCDNDDTGIIFRVAKRIFDILNGRKEEHTIKEVTKGVRDRGMDKGRDKDMERGMDRSKECRIAIGSVTGSIIGSDIGDGLDGDNMCPQIGDTFGREKSSYDFSIRVSYLEIYNEELCDLLSSTSDTNKLRIYEDVTNKSKGLNVDKLEERSINSFEEIYYIICSAIRKRRTAETSYNKKSSRSHSIFTITLIMKDFNREGESITKIGKLNLVDLAGSENALKSSYGNIKIRQQESCNINQSLLTLGRVINALIENSAYIPYRDSKLTRLLQDSLGGKTKTFIVATISPSSLCIDETLSTLDYVFRAKNIKNRPEINVKTTKQLKIKDLNNEIEKLKNALNLSREKRGVYLDNEEYNNIQNCLKQNKEIILQKEKILFEKSKKIKTLLNKMDYTDDIQNQIVQILKEVLLKYKNVQYLYHIIFNKIVEEKYISNFLTNEFHLLEENYHTMVNTYEQTRKNFFSFVNEKLQNMEKKSQKDNLLISDACKTVINILVEMKNVILESKVTLTKSLNNFDQLNSDLYFSRKDALNFVLHHLDLIRTYEKNYHAVVERMKENILACKVDAAIPPMGVIYATVDAVPITDNVASVTDNVASVMDNVASVTDNVASVMDNAASITDEDLIVLKRFAQDSEGMKILHELDTSRMGTCEGGAKSLLLQVEKMNGLFHTFLKSSNLRLKDRVNEKMERLKEEEKGIERVIRKYYEKYETFEKNVAKEKYKIVDTFREKIAEDIKTFQQNVIKEVSEVVGKHVRVVNTQISEKLDNMNIELSKETNKQYRNVFMSSLKLLEEFFYDHNDNVINHFKQCYNWKEDHIENIDQYYFLLENVLTHLKRQLDVENNKMKNDMIELINIYQESIKISNERVDEVATQLDQYASINMKEKEECYQNMSKRINEEKNLLFEGEKKNNLHRLEHNENLLKYTNFVKEHIEKCNEHINGLIESVKTKSFLSDLNTLRAYNHVDDHLQVKNLSAEVENMRALISSHIEEIHKEGEKKNSPSADSAIANTMDNVVNNFSNSLCITHSDTPCEDSTYKEIRQKLLKEIEDISCTRNIDFKCLFEKIDDSLSFLNADPEFSRHSMVSGEYKFTVGGVLDCGGTVNSGTVDGGTVDGGATNYVAANSGECLASSSVDRVPSGVRIGEGSRVVRSYRNTNQSTGPTEDSKISHEYAQKKRSEFFRKTDANVGKANLKLISEHNRKRNKSAENINSRTNSLAPNEVKISTSKIKGTGMSSNFAKNSPALKKIKEEGFRSRNMKLLRKSED